MSTARGFDRASQIRHLAIALATIAAYQWQERLGATNLVLWILGAAALLNLLTYLLSDKPRLGRLSRRLSPVFGVGGWAALVAMTHGVESPFVLGLGLEIVLSAMSLGTTGIALISALSVAALCGQQAMLGLPRESVVPLALPMALLAAIGGVTALLSQLWARDRGSLSARSEALARRLADLEREIVEARVVGRVGENVARLAHGLKNAVHSLRGFSALLEPEMLQHQKGHDALEGLCTAIDRLEELARMALGEPASCGDARPVCSGEQARRAIEHATAEVAACFPAIRWSARLEAGAARLASTPEIVREVLLVVLRNAAEAMQGRGEVVLQAHAAPEGLRIAVRDHGCGLSPDDLERLFRPGRTTKPDGSGYGLYLARRLVESHGGRLTAAPAPGGGAELSILLRAAEA